MSTIKTTFYLTHLGMSDALLLIHGLMKIALFIGVMVLVATAPSLADAAGHGPQTAMQFAELGLDDEPSWLRRMLNDHGNDQWMEPDLFEPMVNIDGTMMLGDFDVNGNMYGVTDSHFDSWDSNDASSMFD